MLLLGGVVADRREPRLVMLVVNVVRIAVLVATALWVIVAGTTVPVLIAAAVAFGLCDALYQPSVATISRQLVPPEQLRRTPAPARRPSAWAAWRGLRSAEWWWPRGVWAGVRSRTR
ncbi:hypothetical protein GCM10023350_46280 [Nocardioides endophyticus]|uniref:MFS transporter n=1 Tax=Nocardioides endophyticus TaxID=1353775 RepID=A0ABP8ZG78_9ACTN